MEKLEKALSELGVDYTQDTIRKFSEYMDGILLWNEKINLTAIKDRDEFIVKHFIDSVLAAGEPEVASASDVIDVGTGAGFPGIPLAIIFPEKRFVLMDSLNKRLKVIDELCEKIGIGNVTTVHSRAEELAKNKLYRGRFDLCVSRAVANMATLSEYCLPFLKNGGYFLAYKGPDFEEELSQAKNAIRILGGEYMEAREAVIPDFNLAHKILFVKKVKDTPSKYPRKAGTPSKEPLK